MTNPQQLLRGLIGHRMQREKQILRLVGEGRATIPEIVAAAYPGLDPRLVPAAGGSVSAHLMDLERRGLVHRERRDMDRPPDQAARHSLADRRRAAARASSLGIAHGHRRPDLRRTRARDIASASLESMRAQNGCRRSSRAMSRWSAADEHRLGGLVRSARKVILPGDVRYQLDLSKLETAMSLGRATHTLRVTLPEIGSPGPTSISTRPRIWRRAACCRPDHAPGARQSQSPRRRRRPAPQPRKRASRAC